MIEFKNISKSFGDQKILDGINIHFPKGKISVVIGRSGAGKSVILKQIMGFLQPDSGQVLIDGQDTTNFTPLEWRKIRKKFGMLFQDSALFDSMNVWENVAFPLIEHTSKSHSEIDTIVKEKLKLVGLNNAEQKATADLSGGMRKRVALARAIALDPEIVLFDEPTSGLDPIVTTVIDHLIIDTQRATGCTYIVISHDITAAFRIADKIAMIYDGKIVIDADKEEVKNTNDPLVKQFITGSLEGPFDIFY
ncbi:MAG: ABC transporter ATP-binding protein [SAR324 cluster bacterium]|nr:ABC transporter ATP-binding protein [SAR324 cluster bacterium]